MFFFACDANILLFIRAKAGRSGKYIQICIAAHGTKICQVGRPKRHNMAKGGVYKEQPADRWVHLLPQRNDIMCFYMSPLIALNE